MGRPRLERGRSGEVSLTAQVREGGRWITAPDPRKAERWRARTKVRDRHDSVVREVARYGRTKTAAKRALEDALESRGELPRAGRTMTADMPLRDAAQVWLAQVDRPESPQSAETASQYREAVERHVNRNDIATLALADANDPPTIRAFLEHVADNHGSGSARTARTVVSGILQAAIDDGVLRINAVRSVRLPKSKNPRKTHRDTTRAFTRTERDNLLRFIAADEASQRRDLPDVVRLLAGTGVRISEALAVRWDDLDLDAGTVHVRGTKSDAADRHLNMPEWLVDALRERKDRAGVTSSGLLFPSRRDTVRNDVNVHHQLRDVLDRAGFQWATSHTFRRTVATLLHAAGRPLIATADQLGHSDPSMTARVYLGRRGDISGNSEVL